MPLVKDHFHVKAGKDVFELNNGRLNHHIYMLLHVYKDRTDAPTLADVANDFVGENFPRTISQIISLFRQNQLKRKIWDKNERYCRHM